MRWLVIAVMSILITAKNSRKRMVSKDDITQHLINNKMPDQIKYITEALDELIKLKMVWYYDANNNERYYGLTQNAWKKIDELQQHKEVAVSK